MGKGQGSGLGAGGGEQGGGLASPLLASCGHQPAVVISQLCPDPLCTDGVLYQFPVAAIQISTNWVA